ncbi:MAG: hypothetical protein ACLU24_04630 [Candidatus Pseudoruminococcus sp.]
MHGYYDDIHSVYEYTTQTKFPSKGVFNVWSSLHNIWGLEIYLSPNEPERNYNCRDRETYSNCSYV